MLRCYTTGGGEKRQKQKCKWNKQNRTGFLITMAPCRAKLHDTAQASRVQRRSCARAKTPNPRRPRIKPSLPLQPQHLKTKTSQPQTPSTCESLHISSWPVHRIAVLAIANVVKPIPCPNRKNRLTRSEHKAQASGWHATQRAGFHGGGFFVPDCWIFFHFASSKIPMIPCNFLCLDGPLVAPNRKLVKAPELLDLEPQIERNERIQTSHSRAICCVHRAKLFHSISFP